MSEKPPVPLAEDISAQSPMNNATRHTLIAHGADADFLDRRIDSNRYLIIGALDNLQIAIEMSSLESVSPVLGLQDERPITQKLLDFAVTPPAGSPPPEVRRQRIEGVINDYNEVRRSPAGKIDYDIQLATTYLRCLGSSNVLRQADGHDAAFDFGHIKHLLETDFMALPETEQKPELRMTEALLAEETALLWTPVALSKASQPGKTGRKGSGKMIANTSDRNVFDKQQVKELDQKKRWRMTGARLCDEAAELFESIYLSKTASPDVRIEAVSRMVDMSVRSLRLQRSYADKAGKLAIEDKIDRMATKHMELVVGWWRNNSVRRAIQTGKLFESICLAKERNEMIQKGNFTDTIRLAMPREDYAHGTIGSIFNQSDEKLNVSVDLVVEDTNGNKIVCFQSKAMSEAEYKQRRSRNGSAVVYPGRDIEMRFLDSAGYEEILQVA